MVSLHNMKTSDSRNLHVFTTVLDMHCVRVIKITDVLEESAASFFMVKVTKR
jgi:hypothetical protein